MSVFILLGLTMAAEAFAADGKRRAVFSPEPAAVTDLGGLHPPPPSAEGKVNMGPSDGRLLERDFVSPLLQRGSHPLTSPFAVDVLVQRGSENALAIDVGDPNNLVTTYNPVSPFSMHVSSDGGASWLGASFPNGSDNYAGNPFDPWANQGNSNGELFATLIRRNLDVLNARVLIARSDDGGATWPLFYENVLSQDVFQDRAMVDIDRTGARGGGFGMAHDGKLYLAWDDAGPLLTGYRSSLLSIISPVASLLEEITISTNFNFNGSKLQPLAGTIDGQVYLMAVAFSGSPQGATKRILFHEIAGGGEAVHIGKSSFSFDSTGQQLGTSARFGVNGHRINSQMFMDIDRSGGPFHGDLYVISDRNPNPGNMTQDQGDVHLSVSTDGAGSWMSALIPGQRADKTQFFSMMDIDDNGWIHVAYYQNETGLTDGGVLNASTANIYYTRSKDGGATWSPHIQVNANGVPPAGNTLNYNDPPGDNSAGAWYLIGDYCQIKVSGTGPSTRPHICWSEFDKISIDTNVICSTVTCWNETVDANEECDDGNQVDNDGCDSNCTFTGCGNGILTFGEECDDWNTADGDGCSSLCLLELCGDGTLDAYETCDDGNAIEGDGCDSNCRPTGCGNEIQTSGENCDDGNPDSCDGCSSSCAVEIGFVCGDGEFNPACDPECDDGNGIDDDGCDSNCTFTGCGNGIQTSGEECDDANSMDGDGCSALCVVEFCGDGLLNDAPNERCDDGNTSNGDGCDSACRIETVEISGHKLFLKDKAGKPEQRRMILLSKDLTVEAPAPGGGGDPTQGGAELWIVNPSTLEEQRFILPAINWKGLGNPAGIKGYKYRDKSGPCRSLLVRDGRLKVSCKGSAISFTLDELQQGSIVATLKLGTDLPYCMFFGGTVKKDRTTVLGKTGLFNAKSAPSPSACPAP